MQLQWEYPLALGLLEPSEAAAHTRWQGQRLRPIQPLIWFLKKCVLKSPGGPSPRSTFYGRGETGIWSPQMCLPICPRICSLNKHWTPRKCQTLYQVDTVLALLDSQPHVGDALTWAPARLKRGRVSQLDLKGFAANWLSVYLLSVY